MAFQINLTSEDMFKSDLLEVPGVLQILEVYQGWCGPCKPLKEMCKRLFFDYADKGLKFYTCEADTLSRTKEFKGNCKPTFLFYKDGAELTDLKISGVNYPQMVQTVTKILA